LTEQELIQGCVRHDRQCQKLLFDKFSGRFMTTCLRYANNHSDAEDMMQESFMNIFISINTFRNQGAFEGWLTKVVVHSCLHYLREKNLNIVADENSIQIPVEDKFSYETISEAELLKLINNLPAGYRVVFNLFVIEGYNHEEIGKLLNIQASTSRTQLVKARKMLQQQIINLQKIAV
jgi:RNA polymerase sigma factor (sigma-70 family)